MNYWLDLFTGISWKEFRDAGAKVSGFRHRMRNAAGKVQSGDIFLCYLTGVMHWVGALEVVGRSSDTRRIWKDEEFPVRFEIKPLVMLNPEFGIPMLELAGKVAFYETTADAPGYKAFLRQSPNLFKRAPDGELILSLLRQAEKNPGPPKEIDPGKLNRTPLFRAERRKGKTTISTVVSVPQPEEAEPATRKPEPAAEDVVATTRHTEIQFHLLALGADMGYEVWIARNDRSKKWNGQTLGDMPHVVDELPTQFNEATNRTIELIDVLWLKGNSIVHAFEVECTTAVYSGLLRMSDLLALQPNLEISLFLVAPDERRDKVEQEILRPTFALRDKTLAKICGFLGFNTLMKKLEIIRRENLVSSLKPDFLQKTAEYFSEDQAAD
jgi:hypothetical protein